MPAGSGAVCNGSVGVIPPQEESTMKLSIARIALAPALLLLALPAAAAPQSHGIHVRAFIDGRSQLVLDGSMARWEHFDFAAPGRLECNLGAEIQPTYIDGEAWYPEWPDRVDCENRDCGCSSSLFTRMHQPVPDAEIFPVFEVIQGRGSSALVELPVAANGYRIVIEFNDNAMGGADWYEVCLTLPDCGVQRYCSATPNSTGEAAYLEIAGSLSIQMNETVLTAMNCPPSTMGIFFCGENKSQLPCCASAPPATACTAWIPRCWSRAPARPSSRSTSACCPSSAARPTTRPGRSSSGSATRARAAPAPTSPTRCA
jgi:hypothetical protein